jgi:DNA (cytosine-5)-methyltransferase 1
MECAVLQTFPDDFRWGQALDEWGPTNVREMIGEAVPPRFTRAHGESLVRILGEAIDDSLIDSSDPRVTRAAVSLSLAI